MNILLDNMLWEFRNRYRAILGSSAEAHRAAHHGHAGFEIQDRGERTQALLQHPHPGRDPLPPHNDYMNPIAVEDVLRTCALGRSQFHALFKDETGQTFTDYLAGVRCDKAAELLVNSDRTILDIAEACGFGNLSHFYHVFRKRKGTSPRRYREEIHPEDLI
jgi:AraC-like DNA-binding protein